MKRALSATRALAVMSGGPVLLAVLASAALGVAIVALLAGDPVPVWSLVVVAATAAYVVGFAPWTRTWGATREERRAVLPGDELVPNRGLTMTRALTVDAPVGAVWSWLAQIGQDRAGFYSYTWLENLAGCHMPTADGVHPEWQHRSVGDVVPLHPLNGLMIERFDPERAYVFAGGWGFVLAPVAPDRTRLIVRSRVRHGLPSFAYAVLVELPHFVMERKMLLGVKHHAEHADALATVLRLP